MTAKAKAERSWPASTVELREVAGLIPNPRNSRRHSDEQVAQIAALIEKYGFTRALLIDEGDMIIAGEGRWRAAKLLKLAEVPIMRAVGWSDEEKRAYMIADNKVGENSEWDEDTLRSELEALTIEGFDPMLTGFSEKEIGRLLDEEDKQQITVVERQDTSPVADRFWISVRGPLASQADALQKLRAVMADLPKVEVELGTTPVD